MVPVVYEDVAEQALATVRTPDGKLRLIVEDSKGSEPSRVLGELAALDGTQTVCSTFGLTADSAHIRACRDLQLWLLVYGGLGAEMARDGGSLAQRTQGELFCNATKLANELVSLAATQSVQSVAAWALWRPIFQVALESEVIRFGGVRSKDREKAPESSHDADKRPSREERDLWCKSSTGRSRLLAKRYRDQQKISRAKSFSAHCLYIQNRVPKYWAEVSKDMNEERSRLLGEAREARSHLGLRGTKPPPSFAWATPGYLGPLSMVDVIKAVDEMRREENESPLSDRSEWEAHWKYTSGVVHSGSLANTGTLKGSLGETFPTAEVLDSVSSLLGGMCNGLAPWITMGIGGHISDACEAYRLAIIGALQAAASSQPGP